MCVYLYSVYGVWLWRMFRNVILEQKMVNNLLSLESISIDAIIISVFTLQHYMHTCDLTHATQSQFLKMEIFKVFYVCFKL